MDLLWLLAIILIVGWMLGFWVVPIGGGLVHLLLVVALVLIIFRLMRGRRIV